MGGRDEVLGEAGGECICRTRERGKEWGYEEEKSGCTTGEPVYT